MKQITSFVSTWKTKYSQQGQTGKILFSCLFLVLFCFLCSILISLFPSRGSSNVVPSPIVVTSEGTQATPTALFNFDFATFTPFPTLPPSTAFPTLTPPPTETQIPTQALPTGTSTPIPTATGTPTISGSSVTLTIVRVDKPAEYVDIQNLSNAPLDLAGWRLVSETGSQSCTLGGVLQPNEVLRIWAGRGEPGFRCGFSRNIWNDSQVDPAVLYNPQGEEVSRYP